MSAVRIAVLGAAGKMGRANVRTIVDYADTEARLTVAVARATSPALGQDAGTAAVTGPTGVVIRADLPAAGEADVWIDFSAPSAAAPNAEAAAVAGARLVVGTTGLSAPDRARIADTARKVAVVFSPNVSVANTARYERHGDVGPRTPQEIGMQTIRGGDVVGDHTVHFLGLGDRIENTRRDRGGGRPGARADRGGSLRGHAGGPA